MRLAKQPVTNTSSSTSLADQFSYYQRGPDAEAALEGLAGIGHPTSVDIFKRQLSNPDPGLRTLAVSQGGALVTGHDLWPAALADAALRSPATIPVPAIPRPSPAEITPFPI